MPKSTRNLIALLVIDVQKAFDELDFAGHRRNNPEAIKRIVDLLVAFRRHRFPIFHVRHRGTRPESPFRAELTGFVVKEEAREEDGETVIVKTANSAFIGTDLEARLRKLGVGRLVICGATTNHCVETTARMAGNLNFDTTLASDATWTYDTTGPDGAHHTAEAVHSMSLANLNGEFARIAPTSEIVENL